MKYQDDWCQKLRNCV